jgi:hypothetical protein
MVVVGRQESNMEAKERFENKKDPWCPILPIPIGSKSTHMRGQMVDRLKLIII